jgi:o-succinylbenzoate synthase
LDIQIRYRALPLTRPYELPFGTVKAFETFVVRAEQDGQIGWGEITPLPGYGAETVDHVTTILRVLEGASASSLTPADLIAQYSLLSPMTVSGLITAIEMATNQAFADCFQIGIGDTVPCVALVGGNDPETVGSEAIQKTNAGFTTLKMKIGQNSPETDVLRVKAVLAMAGPDVKVRLDANQQLSRNAATEILMALDGEAIELFEQPFPPNQDQLMRELAKVSSIPLMLDESIWESKDIERAAALGVGLVKLKLCKHPGPTACLERLRQAQDLGLQVVFGNGVQSAIGNRMELQLYQMANLKMAIESNGFAKMASLAEMSGMTLEGGGICIVDPTVPDKQFEEAVPVANFCMTVAV